MGIVICNQADGLILSWVRFEPFPEVKAGHVAVTADEPPDPRIWRWDGGTGLRAASVTELATYDTNTSDARAARRLTRLVTAIDDYLLANPGIKDADVMLKLKKWAKAED